MNHCAIYVSDVELGSAALCEGDLGRNGFIIQYQTVAPTRDNRPPASNVMVRELSCIDAYVFLALQIFSAISTLMPITFYIYDDTRRMWQRTVTRGITTKAGGNGGTES